MKAGLTEDRPDDHQLGELQEAARRRQDRHDDARLLGDRRRCRAGRGPNPADIGYMPFPYQIDGKFHSVIGGDYKNAININSEHKAAARAWIDWFADESNYAERPGRISPRVGRAAARRPRATSTAAGVELPRARPGARRRGGAGQPDRQRRRRSACGTRSTARRSSTPPAAPTTETKEQIFADLNKRWADASDEAAEPAGVQPWRRRRTAGHSVRRPRSPA